MAAVNENWSPPARRPGPRPRRARWRARRRPPCWRSGASPPGRSRSGGRTARGPWRRRWRARCTPGRPRPPRPSRGAGRSRQRPAGAAAGPAAGALSKRHPGGAPGRVEVLRDLHLDPVGRALDDDHVVAGRDQETSARPPPRTDPGRAVGRAVARPRRRRRGRPHRRPSRRPDPGGAVGTHLASPAAAMHRARDHRRARTGPGATARPSSSTPRPRARAVRSPSRRTPRGVQSEPAQAGAARPRTSGSSSVSASRSARAALRGVVPASGSPRPSRQSVRWSSEMAIDMATCPHYLLSGPSPGGSCMKLVGGRHASTTRGLRAYARSLEDVGVELPLGRRGLRPTRCRCWASSPR